MTQTSNSELPECKLNIASEVFSKPTFLSVKILKILKFQFLRLLTDKEIPEYKINISWKLFLDI